MTIKENIVQTIFAAVEEVNQQLPPQEKLEQSLETVLFGKAGKLDSLGLVNFVVAVEERIEKDLGLAITLADERALSQKRSPFRNIGALADYIQALVEEEQNGR